MALLWLGARFGQRAAAHKASPPKVDPRAFLGRLYFASYLAMGLGAVVAILCYLRFGVPAISGSPDAARTDFISHLSPFTYYQWLLIEVGVGLGVLAVAQDKDAATRGRRQRLILTCIAMVVLVSGVFSRVTIGTPLMIGAIVWWSQGRRFPLALIGTGVVLVVVVVGVVWLLRLQAVGE